MSTTASQPQSHPHHEDLSWTEWAVEMVSYLEEVWISPALHHLRHLLVKPRSPDIINRTFLLSLQAAGTTLRDASLRLRDRLGDRLQVEPPSAVTIDQNEVHTEVEVPAPQVAELLTHRACDNRALEVHAAVKPPVRKELAEAPAIRPTQQRGAQPRSAVRPQPLSSFSVPSGSEQLTHDETLICEPKADVVVEAALTGHSSRCLPAWFARLTAAASARKRLIVLLTILAMILADLLTPWSIWEMLGLVLVATTLLAPALYSLVLIAQLLGIVKDPDEWRDWKQDLTERPVSGLLRDHRPDPDLVAVLENDPLPRRNRLAKEYRYPRQKLVGRT